MAQNQPFNFDDEPAEKPPGRPRPRRADEDGDPPPARNPPPPSRPTSRPPRDDDAVDNRRRRDRDDDYDDRPRRRDDRDDYDDRPRRARGRGRFNLENVYRPDFYVEDIPPDLRRRYARHDLRSFSVPLAILFNFLTLNIYATIACGLKHSKLPLIKRDDFTAGKAIGFLFIPFFNFYWVFVFWLRLTDRINFQFKLRDREPPIPRGLVLTAVILIFIPYLGGAINYLILMPIILAKIQGAANELDAMYYDDEAIDD